MLPSLSVLNNWSILTWTEIKSAYLFCILWVNSWQLFLASSKSFFNEDKSPITGTVGVVDFESYIKTDTLFISWIDITLVLTVEINELFV